MALNIKPFLPLDHPEVSHSNIELITRKPGTQSQSPLEKEKPVGTSCNFKKDNKADESKKKLMLAKLGVVSK